MWFFTKWSGRLGYQQNGNFMVSPFQPSRFQTHLSMLLVNPTRTDGFNSNFHGGYTCIHIHCKNTAIDHEFLDLDFDHMLSQVWGISLWNLWFIRFQRHPHIILDWFCWENLHRKSPSIFQEDHGLFRFQFSHQNQSIYPYIYKISITIWLFNIAMENCPFTDGLPIKNGGSFHGYVKS